MTTIPIPPDWRGLCEELVDEWDAVADQDLGPMADAVDRARAALSQPEPEVVQVTDWRLALEQAADELDMAENALLCSSFHNAAVRAKKAARNARLALLAQPEPEVVGPSLNQLSDWITKCTQNPKENRWTRHVDHHDALAIAKAALYDWGRPAPAPAGERQAAPVPVAVSERLPGAEDCDAEGRCWAWRGFDPDNDDDGEFWQLIHAEWLTAQSGGGWTHWLPAKALPLPSGR